MFFLFTSTNIFIILNIGINYKNINTNRNYRSYIESIKNYNIFYKMIDFLASNN